MTECMILPLAVTPSHPDSLTLNSDFYAYQLQTWGTVFNLPELQFAHLPELIFPSLKQVCHIVKIYFLSNFQVHNTVLLTIVTMLYVSSPEHIHLSTGMLCSFTTTPPCTTPPCPPSRQPCTFSSRHKHQLKPWWYSLCNMSVYQINTL